MSPKRKTAARVPEQLREYRAKRDFEVTSEPAPAPVAPRVAGLPPTFMIHKHDASRLHYDLRLEINGALASWALPHGPSLDPTQKRLAVETEDHPLAYGEFEGRIPDGEYGAGDSIVWDRGVWETMPPGQAEAMRKKGHIAMVLVGEKLKGLWHLVRTKGRPGQASKRPQWLLMKARDNDASATRDILGERPESVVSGRRVLRGPLLVSFVRGPHPAPLELLIKVWPPGARAASKGRTRALAVLSNGRAALQSDAGKDLGAAHPEVLAAIAELEAVEAVLDGDLVPDGGGHALEVADLLWLDGEDVRARPPEARRDLLSGLLAAAWMPGAGRKAAPARVRARAVSPPAKAARTPARAPRRPRP